MKAAIVSIYPPKGAKHAENGGVASYTHNLAQSLKNAGADLTIICNKLHIKENAYTDDGIAIRRVFNKNILYIFPIIKAIRMSKVRVVHFQHELNLYGGALNALLLPLVLLATKRTKRIVTFHGVVSLDDINSSFVQDNNSKLPPFVVKAAFRILFTPLARISDQIIVHEQVFKDRLTRQYGISPHKVTVIPHGVEILEPLDRSQAKKMLGVPYDWKVVLFVGYLTGYKGLDLLIEGFAEYLKVHKDAEVLLLIGAGKHPKLSDNEEYLRDSYYRLENKARETLPAGKYRWVGFVTEKDIPVYYSAADISVYPYTVAMSSSGPMALSIGYRIPFIASDVFEDMFPSLHASLFKKEPASLATVLASQLKDPNAATDIINTLYNERNWDRVAELHAALYNVGGNAS